MKSLRTLRSQLRGFSLLELLIVASLCAILFTTGALAYRAVAQNQRRANTFQEVALTASVAANFFPGSTATTIDCYTAPNYGRATLANQMRNLFYEDVESASAVFPLPRTGNLNTIRERVITIGTLQPAVFDTPAKFLELLTGLSGTSSRAGVFRTFRGAPADSVAAGAAVNYVTNGSIFILQPSGSTTEIWLRAVYEIDYVGYKDLAETHYPYATGMPCVHASVRRYVNNVLTHFYDIVFRESDLSMAGVPFVHFERAVRTNVTEDGITKWKSAGNQPFYLIWWPDPAMPRLKGTAPGIYTGLPLADYAKHEGQTSFTFVIPQFPCY